MPVFVSPLQRRVVVEPVAQCRACGVAAAAAALVRCPKCYTTAYCGVNCQRSDWTQHSKHCRTIDSALALFGFPFLVELPDGATYSQARKGI